jgi:hypothetical protein
MTNAKNRRVKTVGEPKIDHWFVKSRQDFLAVLTKSNIKKERDLARLAGQANVAITSCAE